MLLIWMMPFGNWANFCLKNQKTAISSKNSEFDFSDLNPIGEVELFYFLDQSQFEKMK
jgi:hypothetical protein